MYNRFLNSQHLPKNNLKLFRFVKLPLQYLILFPFFDFSIGEGKCTNPFGFVNITLDFFHTYFCALECSLADPNLAQIAF